MASPLAKLGPALRWLRERGGLSQAEVARRSGISVSVVSRIESDQHRPTLALLDRQLRALDADVLELGFALVVVNGRSGETLTLPAGLSRSERGALAVSFFGFQEFVRAAAARGGAYDGGRNE